MAADGATVIRFYPVQPPEWWGGGSPPAIAIGRQAFRRFYGDFSDPPLTTVYAGHLYNDYATHLYGPYDSDLGGWGGYEYQDFLTLGTLQDVPPGSYTELEFTPCAIDGALQPISVNEFPLTLPVAFSSSDYAGGVFVIGMYQGGEFIELASFQHVSQFFPGHEVPESDWDALPTPQESLYQDPETSALYVVLNASIPRSLFWTSLKQAVEQP